MLNIGTIGLNECSRNRICSTFHIFVFPLIQATSPQQCNFTIDSLSVVTTFLSFHFAVGIPFTTANLLKTRTGSPNTIGRTKENQIKRQLDSIIRVRAIK